MAKADDKPKEDKDKTPAELIAERDAALEERDEAVAGAIKVKEAADKAIEKNAKKEDAKEVDIYADDYDGPMTGDIAEKINIRKAELAADAAAAKKKK